MKSSRVKWSGLGAAGVVAAVLAFNAQERRGSQQGDASAEAATVTEAPISRLAAVKTAAQSTDAVALAAPSIGTRDTADVTPHVPRASGTPCTVELFRNIEFATPGRPFFNDGETDRFPYTPPANCPGPWAKVFLKVAISNQEPATYLDGLTLASVSIGGAVLYAGGGQDNDVPTHWRAERDVTDYSAMLRAAGEGIVELRGLPRYGPRFNSPYYMSATLVFYPANPNNRAQRVPDQVQPLSDQGFASLSTPSSQLVATLTLPRNVEQAYLDVIAQASYGNDLHWFTCLPDALLTEFPELTHPYAIGSNRRGLEGDPVRQGCKGGSFREVMVSIDGQPAGLAPVFPRVYPELTASWSSVRMFQPSPSSRVLSYLPYRVDLTPFAALLSDGAPHTVALSMVSAGGTVDFDVAGTLLVYRDAGTAQVTGQLTRNTLPMLFAPTLVNTLQRNAAGEVMGIVQTGATHQYELAGYIDTSRGRIETNVNRSLAFKNKLSLYAKDPDGEQDDAFMQIVELSSRNVAFTKRWLNGELIVDDADYVLYPLTLIYQFGAASVIQVVSQRTERWRPGIARYYVRLRHEARNRYDTSLAPGVPEDWSGTQSYLFRDSYGSCHRTDTSASNGALTAYQEGLECPDGRNRLFWASRPDGSPDNLGWTGQ